MGRGFTESHLMTIGADFAAKDMTINLGGTDYNVTFQIWDMAGQKRFADIRTRFYYGSYGGLCLFDINREDSFQNLNNWIEELWKYNAKEPKPLPLIILGNKSDLRDRNSIKVKRAEEYCQALSEKVKQYGFTVEYIETSALSGNGVDEAFKAIGEKILRRHLQR